MKPNKFLKWVGWIYLFSSSITTAIIIVYAFLHNGKASVNINHFGEAIPEILFVIIGLPVAINILWENASEVIA